MKIGRWLIVAGSVVLVLSALLHGSGYLKVTGGLAKSDAALNLVAAFRALWMMYSFHLALLGAVFYEASRTARARLLVLLGALIPASDAVLMFHFLGVFMGTVALAVATLLLLAGGFLLKEHTTG
jgi:hypothetical protein